MAQQRKWDGVRAELEVYKYSDEDVKIDPRREDAYRQKVVDGLGFGEKWKTERPYLETMDVELVRFCLWLIRSRRLLAEGDC